MTVLTGFAVAWGIFMLIVLLGSGEGLRSGVEYQMRDDAVNSIWVSSGDTSKPYKGLQPGRRIRFDMDDYEEVTTRVKGVEYSSGRFMIFGNQQVNYEEEWGSFTIRAVHPGHQVLEKTVVTQGRYINQIDIREFRKIALVGSLVKDALFGEAPALGREIKINGISFKVVGIFEDAGSEQEREMIYTADHHRAAHLQRPAAGEPDPLHHGRRLGDPRRVDGRADQGNPRQESHLRPRGSARDLHQQRGRRG